MSPAFCFAFVEWLVQQAWSLVKILQPSGTQPPESPSISINLQAEHQGKQLAESQWSLSYFLGLWTGLEMGRVHMGMRGAHGSYSGTKTPVEGQLRVMGPSRSKGFLESPKVLRQLNEACSANQQRESKLMPEGAG